MTALGSLLQELEGGALGGPSLAVAPEESSDDQLAKRRLGIAGSLFTALQCKHAATASHSMRVALTCSAWATRLDFDARQREELEIVALLHDVGIVGTPDHVLLKPTRLDSDEAAIMGRARSMSPEILRRSCTSSEILQIVENISTWYDGSRGAHASTGLNGEQIPLAARMIAVAEAFDAMTTDRVYRPAFSQERAMAELFRSRHAVRPDSGAAVHGNARRRSRPTPQGRGYAVAAPLDPQTANAYWELHGRAVADRCRPARRGLDLRSQAPRQHVRRRDLRQPSGPHRALEPWGRTADGHPRRSIRQQRWQPDILKLCDEKDHAISETRLPGAGGHHSGVQSLRRLTVWGRNGRCVAVDTHVIPVIGGDGNTQGAILLLHDASSEISLEQRCQSLARQGQPRPIDAGGQSGRVRSRSRDVHRRPSSAAGPLQRVHVRPRPLQAGQRHLRPPGRRRGHQEPGLAAEGRLPSGDLVARYGGEEFVVLLRRLRQHHRQPPRRPDPPGPVQIPQPTMNGQSITVSFGVTEIQPGDTPEPCSAAPIGRC